MDQYETIRLGTQTLLAIDVFDRCGDAVALDVTSCRITIRRKSDGARVVDNQAVSAGLLTNQIEYEWEPEAIGDYEAEWYVVSAATSRGEYSPSYPIKVVRRIAA